MRNFTKHLFKKYISYNNVGWQLQQIKNHVAHSWFVKVCKLSKINSPMKKMNLILTVALYNMKKKISKHQSICSRIHNSLSKCLISHVIICQCLKKKEREKKQESHSVFTACFRVKTTQNDGEGHIWRKFCSLGDTKMIYNKSVIFSVKISDEVANTIRLWSWQSHASFSMLVAGYWFTSALQRHIRHTPLTDIHLPWEAEDSIAGWESQSPWDTWRKQIWGI